MCPLASASLFEHAFALWSPQTVFSERQWRTLLSYSVQGKERLFKRLSKHARFSKYFPLTFKASSGGKISRWMVHNPSLNKRNKKETFLLRIACYTKCIDLQRTNLSGILLTFLCTIYSSKYSAWFETQNMATGKERYNIIWKSQNKARQNLDGPSCRSRYITDSSESWTREPWASGQCKQGSTRSMDHNTGCFKQQFLLTLKTSSLTPILARDEDLQRSSDMPLAAHLYSRPSHYFLVSEKVQPHWTKKYACAKVAGCYYLKWINNIIAVMNCD